jgi:outer membrane protein TolC
MSVLNYSTVRSLLSAAIGLAIISTTVGCASVVAPTKRQDASIEAGLSPAAAAVDGPSSEAALSGAVAPWPTDPALDMLLNEARRGSLDLAAARARLESARATVDVAARGMTPQGGATARAVESQLSVVEADPYNQGAPRPPRRRIFEAGFAISWELDLFGRIGTAKAIALRGLDSQTATMAGTEALVEAEIVRLYALYRERQSALTSLDRALVLSAQRTQDVKQRVDGGLSEPPELWQVEAAYHALRAERATADAGMRSARNQLLSAVGVSPAAAHPVSDALAQPAALPALPRAGDYRLPDDFLSRRPDVLVAEAQLRAAIGETALAERASWPSLRLLGSLASIALPGEFGEAATRSLGVGPVIEWNWLSFGRNQLQEAAARAGEQAIAAEFEGTVLRAVSDADSAIRNWEAARAAWVEATEAAKAAQRVSERSTTRSELGLEPRVSAINGELDKLAADRGVVEAQAQALAAYAALRLAFGVQMEAAGD